MNKILLVFFISVTICEPTIYDYTPPKGIDDGWKTAGLKSQDADTSVVDNFLSQLKNEKHKVHSILIIKDNQLKLEEYFNGFSMSKSHDLRSATKSIISLLIGIAVDKGLIKNIDDPISKYLKDPSPTKNLDERKNNITIRHLLTMSSGLDCNDWDKTSKGQEDKVYRKKDWLQYTLNLPMDNEPGKESNYCSMGVVLLAEIISQCSGLPIEEFAEKYLFKYLNIKDAEWGHTSRKKVIASAKRLYLTPRDMAKIGQLVLNKGNWQGNQVVSEKWIQESTSTKTKITGIDYGYLWWILPLNINGEIQSSIVATGNGGQYIIILPEINMVAVFTGGAYNSEDDKIPFTVMNRILLPAFNR